MNRGEREKLKIISRLEYRVMGDIFDHKTGSLLENRKDQPIEVDPLLRPGYGASGLKWYFERRDSLNGPGVKETFEIAGGDMMSYGSCWVYFWESINQEFPALNYLYVIVYESHDQKYYLLGRPWPFSRWLDLWRRINK